MILGSGIQEGLLLKPVTYSWAYDLYNQAVANTWFPNEIQLDEDLADFARMTPDEHHALTHLMSYFNPNELLVNKALAFGVYPYVNAAECHLVPGQADVGGGQPLYGLRVCPRNLPD